MKAFKNCDFNWGGSVAKFTEKEGLRIHLLDHFRLICLTFILSLFRFIDRYCFHYWRMYRSYPALPPTSKTRPPPETFWSTTHEIPPRSSGLRPVFSRWPGSLAPSMPSGKFYRPSVKQQLLKTSVLSQILVIVKSINW